MRRGALWQYCCSLRHGTGMEPMGNVAPFILRGVTLKGIDSVMFAKEKSGDLAAGGTVFTGVQTG